MSAETIAVKEPEMLGPEALGDLEAWLSGGGADTAGGMDALRQILDPQTDETDANVSAAATFVDSKLPREQQLRELREFTAGDRAKSLWDALPVEDAPRLHKPLMRDNILGTLEVDHATERDSVHNARARVKEILREEGFDKETLDDAEIAASELITNVKRTCPINGGSFAMGIDQQGRVVLIADGNVEPRNVTYRSAEVFNDAAEHGRGVKLVAKLGRATKLPIAFDTEGKPTAWRVVSIIDPRKQLLMRFYEDLATLDALKRVKT